MPEAALNILEQNPERYDLGVVAAPHNVAVSVTNQKLLASLGSASSG